MRKNCQKNKEQWVEVVPGWLKCLYKLVLRATQSFSGSESQINTVTRKQYYANIASNRIYHKYDIFFNAIFQYINNSGLEYGDRRNE